MTSPNRRLSLEEVLDETFFNADKPSPAMALQACEAHPEFREDILEFAALWSSYEASPEPERALSLSEVPDEAVSRLQSFVLNRIHELDQKPAQADDIEAAKKAVASLAGGALRRAAVASELGNATLLLQKVLTNSILDTPTRVLSALASYLRVAPTALQLAISGGTAIGRSYRASDKPTAPTKETWEKAVRSLTLPETERQRLLELQGRE